jgi:hypothetical protein
VQLSPAAPLIRTVKDPPCEKLNENSRWTDTGVSLLVSPKNDQPPGITGASIQYACPSPSIVTSGADTDSEDDGGDADAPGNNLAEPSGSW